jgi:hypothetical protein
MLATWGRCLSSGQACGLWPIDVDSINQVEHSMRFGMARDDVSVFVPGFWFSPDAKRLGEVGVHTRSPTPNVIVDGGPAWRDVRLGPQWLMPSYPLAAPRPAAPSHPLPIIRISIYRVLELTVGDDASKSPTSLCVA